MLLVELQQITSSNLTAVLARGALLAPTPSMTAFSQAVADAAASLNKHVRDSTYLTQVSSAIATILTNGGYNSAGTDADTNLLRQAIESLLVEGVVGLGPAAPAETPAVSPTTPYSPGLVPNFGTGAPSVTVTNH